MAWYKWFPFVNLVYDFLFDEEPTVEGVKDIMNALGLVCALLLGVVISMPGSVDFDELTAANERYRTVPELRDVYTTARYDLPNTQTLAEIYGPNAYSNRLMYYLAGASGALTCSLLSIVLSYFFLSAADFQKEAHPATGKSMDTHAVMKRSTFKVWWSVVRFLCLQQFISTAVGVVMTFISVMVMMDIKFPDPDCPDYKHAVLKPICAHAYFANATIVVLWCTLIGCLFVLSIAAALKYHEEAKAEAEQVAREEEEAAERPVSPEEPAESGVLVGEKLASADAAAAVRALSTNNEKPSAVLAHHGELFAFVRKTTCTRCGGTLEVRRKGEELYVRCADCRVVVDAAAGGC